MKTKEEIKQKIEELEREKLDFHQHYLVSPNILTALNHYADNVLLKALNWVLDKE